MVPLNNLLREYDKPSIGLVNEIGRKFMAFCVFYLENS